MNFFDGTVAGDRRPCADDRCRTAGHASRRGRNGAAGLRARRGHAGAGGGAAGKDRAVGRGRCRRQRRGTIDAAAYLGERSHFHVMVEGLSDTRWRWRHRTRCANGVAIIGAGRCFCRWQPGRDGAAAAWRRLSTHHDSLDRCARTRAWSGERARASSVSKSRGTRRPAPAALFRPGVAVSGSSVPSSAMRSTWVSACSSRRRRSALRHPSAPSAPAVCQLFQRARRCWCRAHRASHGRVAQLQRLGEEFQIDQPARRKFQIPAVLARKLGGELAAHVARIGEQLGRDRRAR